MLRICTLFCLVYITVFIFNLFYVLISLWWDIYIRPGRNTVMLSFSFPDVDQGRTAPCICRSGAQSCSGSLSPQTRCYRTCCTACKTNRSLEWSSSDLSHAQTQTTLDAMSYLSCPNTMHRKFAIHTKGGQAQTSLHKSRLRGTEKNCYSPCPARGSNPGFLVLISNPVNTPPSKETITKENCFH